MKLLVALLLGLCVSLSSPSAMAAPFPKPDAAAWLVVYEGPNGRGILATNNANAKRAVASLTKLMTAHLVLRFAKLDSVIATTPDALVGESVVPLRVGEKQRVGDLLAALVVRSANDSAVMLARAVVLTPESRSALRAAAPKSRGPGTPVARFVALMNAEARRLGLARTGYVSPYGLDAPGAFSTAHDVLQLARLDMADRRFRVLARQRVAVIPGHRLPSRNKLLRSYRSLDGVKTGHTSRAGWNLAASARRASVRIYAIDLGAPNETQRDLDVSRILDWAFARVRPLRLVSSGEVFGSFGTTRAIVTSSFQIIGTGAFGVTRTVELPEKLTHAVRKGERLGSLIVARGATTLATLPLVADRADPGPPSRLDRLWESLASLF